jgi:vibriolysin
MAAILTLAAIPVSGSSVDMLFPEIPVESKPSAYEADKAAYGTHLAEQLSASLYPEAGVVLERVKTRPHANGATSYKFHQRIGNLNVIYGDIVLHTDDEGEIFYFRGPVLQIDNSFKGQFEPPSSTYLDKLVTTYTDVDGPSDLQFQFPCYFYEQSTEQTVPVYVFYTHAGFGIYPESMKVIAHAETAEVLEETPLLIPALDRKIYDLNYGSTPPANPTRKEGDAPTGINDVDDAYDSSGATYDMLNNRFGRDSYDDSGSAMVVDVRYLVPTPDNAFWNIAGQKVRIGGGSENYAEAYDVMAHEFGHGVAFDEGLSYSGQAAALHESFGDCMGALFDEDNGGIVWELSEDRTSGTLRYLDDPESHGGPDYIDEIIGQQHHDSGIASLAFYLAAEGGTHPRGESTIDVNGIGLDEAGDVLYEALVGYYDSSETFAEAAVDWTLAALITEGYAECAAFASAWHAVGVDDAFWHGGIGDYALSYMGTYYFDVSGTDFQLGPFWYYYTNYDSSNGEMDIYSYNTGTWFWTSAEEFPRYWDYSEGAYNTFTGFGFI